MAILRADILRTMTTLNDLDLILEKFYPIWFTQCDARYRCLKGARATGKSYNFIGVEPVFKLLVDKRRNVMMVRQNYKDNAQSNFTLLKSLIYKLHIENLFKFTTSPHQIKRKDTGQVILFGGMNDVENLTSTSVESGYWTDIYFEEASQLKSYDDFRVVDGSLRIPNYENDLKAQITFCFNAWDVGHWLYDVFFKGNLEDNIEELEDKGYQYWCDDNFNIGADGNGLALHISSYKCNPYLSEAKIEGMKMLKDKAYDIYLVEGLGCWGNTADKTYTHWNDDLIISEQVINQFKFDAITVGIDTGLSNGEGKIKYSEDNAPRLGSAMTMQLQGEIDDWNKVIAIDEYFDSNIGRSVVEKKTEPQYIHELCQKLVEWCDMYQLWDDTIMCYVDCADTGFRDNMEAVAMDYGLVNCKFIGSTKHRILTRVSFENLMMAYSDMLFSSRCKNLVREIRNARKSKEGKCREDFDDHAINAWEYAWAPIAPRVRRWKTFKVPE